MHGRGSPSYASVPSLVLSRPLSINERCLVGPRLFVPTLSSSLSLCRARLLITASPSYDSVKFLRLSPSLSLCRARLLITASPSYASVPFLPLSPTLSLCLLRLLITASPSYASVPFLRLSPSLSLCLLRPPAAVPSAAPAPPGRRGLPRRAPHTNRSL